MTTQEQYIARLREIVQTKFGRRISTMEDCDALSEAVGEATNIKLDSRAYMPIFSSGVAPRPVALSTLARYLGYGSWSDFCASSDVTPAKDTDIIPVVRRWGVIILTLLAIVVVVGAIIFLLTLGKGGDDASRLAPLAEGVEERWVARTLEECNALRGSAEAEDYAEQVDLFVAGYEDVMTSGVSQDLHREAERQGLDVDDEDLAPLRDAIVARCKAMCEVLYLEM